MKQDIKKNMPNFLWIWRLVVKTMRKIMLNFRKEKKKLKEEKQLYIQ